MVSLYLFILLNEAESLSYFISDFDWFMTRDRRAAAAAGRWCRRDVCAVDADVAVTGCRIMVSCCIDAGGGRYIPYGKKLST